MKSQIHKQENDVWLLFDSRDVGGIETHILQLAQGLKQFQRSVQVIFLCKYEQNHPLTIALNNANISYRFLDGTLRDLLDYTRHHRPRVIHSHGYKAAIYSRLLRLSLLTSQRKIRFINTFHAGEIGKGKLALYDIIDRWSALFSHHNFAVSERINQRIPSQTTVLNNFIDTTNLRSSTGEQIAFVGRLSHEKAPDRFIKLAKQHPSNSFHLYGSGPMEQELIKQLPCNVVFHGQQNSMETIWNEIGLLIISSRYEGLPITALEAMGRGIPVISTPVGNISKLIQSERNGWIVKPEDLSQTISHWLELSPINKIEIQQAAQKTIQDQFSTKTIVPIVLKAYGI
ncbi:glycosyltransferase family 4 protein [Aliivibrio sp. S3MY1]|uniref:glycosyltransferase family 4 protein n=1 Tax=unclassified Aliivibrio TaxID=2645654 RepID=UPI0023785751|nr:MULTISPECIES: glycosyltransferase family 4 protein [unclassified Aliivibrio]MDD9194445.1 glycosyltransferase family 4 protein [Aliivibrio sp. S3MY1]MDD9198216.1 glycosyltransferase family 4 protein [Aliivibrio sp. S2MY1]